MEAKVRQGRTLDQVQQEVTLEDLRPSWPAWKDPELDDDWKAVMKVLVERAWRGVRGQG